MVLHVVVHPEPVAQRGDDVLGQIGDAVRRDLCRGVHLLDQYGETFAPRVGFDVGEAGALPGQLEGVVGGGDGGLLTTSVAFQVFSWFRR